MSIGPRRRQFVEKTVDAQRACVQAGECRPRARSSKNTRDWCKGKPGIPHTWEWVDDPTWRVLRRRDPAEERWREQCRMCFGCGRGRWPRRVHCRVCGSPERYFEIDIRTRQITHEPTIHTRTVGPFCLCPDHFDERATVQFERWFSRAVEPWADDPDQILKLRGFAR